MRRSPGLIIAGIAVLAAACAEHGASDRLLAPSRDALHGAQPHLTTPVLLTTFLQPVLDPETQTTYQASGGLQLAVAWLTPTAVERWLFPPGPCRSSSLLPAVQDGMVEIDLCAVIDNAGGAALVGGGLALNSDPNQRGGILVPFGVPALFPPGPCRTYVVRGALAVDDALATALSDRPGDIAALFEFQEVNELPGGEIRGVFGPPSGGPGDPGTVSGFQEVNEVDPGCVIDVTLAARS